MAATGTLPSAGEYNDEDAYDHEADVYRRRAIKVTCPRCKKTATPLVSRFTEVIRSGWRWVGIEHQEPYATYKAKHSCGQEYTFTTYTPQ